MLFRQSCNESFQFIRFSSLAPPALAGEDPVERNQGILHPYCSDGGEMKVSSPRQSDSLVLPAPTSHSTTLFTSNDEPVDEPVYVSIEAGVQRLEQHDDEYH
jgi:hypothetical protein